MSKGTRLLTKGKDFSEAVFILSHLDNSGASFFILFFSSSVSSECASHTDVKVLCRGITFRQAQICPDLPSLSELAHYAVACDVCRQESFGFPFISSH